MDAKALSNDPRSHRPDRSRNDPSNVVRMNSFDLQNAMQIGPVMRSK